MRRIALLLVLLPGVLLAPAAAAARTELPKGTEGQLAGDRLVSSVSSPDGSYELRATPLSGGPAVTVATIPRYGTRSDQGQDVQFAASAAGVLYTRGGFTAFGYKTVTYDFEFFQAVWVPFDGSPPRVLQECTSADATIGVGGGPDVDGSIVAWREGCGKGGIRAADAASPAEPVAVTPSITFGYPRVTGDYVAYDSSWVSPPALAVKNWRTGTIVTALPTDGSPGAFDVLEDGTLLLVTGEHRYALRAYPPGDGAGRTIVGPATSMGDPHVAGGRIALAFGASGCPQQLNLVARDGRLTPVACLDVFHTKFEFDGRRMLFTEARCDDTWTVTLAAVDEAFGTPPAPRCPVLIADRTMQVSASGRARARVTCPDSCYGTLEFVGPDRRTRSRHFSFGAGPTIHAVDVRLPASLLRAVKRAGRLRVTAGVYADSPLVVRPPRTGVRVTLIAKRGP